jgi:Mce-associated membrane protein
VAVAAAAFWFVQNKNNEDLLEAQDQARTAACRYAPVLANYDAKDLDAYFAAVLDGATGDWKKQFDSTSRELREVLTQGEVVSKTNDVQCAIRTADESSAEAIVVIGQSITSLGTQGKPAPGQLSMVLRLEKSGDRWLVNKVNSPLAPPRLP